MKGEIGRRVDEGGLEEEEGGEIGLIGREIGKR